MAGWLLFSDLALKGSHADLLRSWGVCASWEPKESCLKKFILTPVYSIPRTQVLN